MSLHRWLKASLFLGAALICQAASAIVWTVEVRDNYYYDVVTQSPNSVINAGDTIRWVWTGHHNHSVSSYQGLFETLIQPMGFEFSYTFDQPGVYTYYCIPHFGQEGAVTVVPEPSAAPMLIAGAGALRFMLFKRRRH